MPIWFLRERESRQLEQCFPCIGRDVDYMIVLSTDANG
jgi:hypothetical protein